MKIFSVWYGHEGSPYHRMARVLARTIDRYHNGRVEIVHGVGRPRDRSEAFRLKARDWTSRISDAENGEALALLDADTFLQRPIADIETRDFDIAITTHKGRLNSGVLFVRPSPRVREFFAEWPALTDAWCEKNRPDAIRYGDQDALDQLLRRCAAGLKVLDLPMAEWNSTQRTWHLRLANARIVHFKSKARAHVFEGSSCNALSMEVAARWKAIENGF